MVTKIEDGSVITVAQLLTPGELQNSKEQTLTITQSGNTFTATIGLADGTGRNEIWRGDKSDETTQVIMSRKVR